MEKLFNLPPPKILLDFEKIFCLIINELLA